MPVTVRPASEADLSALTRLDLTYPTDRVLALDRAGEPPEHTFALRWRNHVPAPMAVYATYTIDRLRQALSTTDLALVAEVDGEVAGLLILVVPEWTDAAEITDLAIDIAFRRLGAGHALIEAAADWARGRGYREMASDTSLDNTVSHAAHRRVGYDEVDRVIQFRKKLSDNRKA